MIEKRKSPTEDKMNKISALIIVQTGAEATTTGTAAKTSLER